MVQTGPTIDLSLAPEVIEEGVWSLDGNFLELNNFPFRADHFAEIRNDGSLFFYDRFGPSTPGGRISLNREVCTSTSNIVAADDNNFDSDVENNEIGNPQNQLCVDSDGDGWGWDGSASCRVDASNQPAGAPPPQDSCDYSDADLFAGWGWNSVTQESCPPIGVADDNSDNNNGGTSDVLTDSCDYSDAASHGGWGWNPVTRESCPPQNQSVPVDSGPTQTQPGPIDMGCSYADAASHGGWGWNPVTLESCPPL